MGLSTKVLSIVVSDFYINRVNQAVMHWIQNNSKEEPGILSQLWRASLSEVSKFDSFSRLTQKDLFRIVEKF